MKQKSFKRRGAAYDRKGYLDPVKADKTRRIAESFLPTPFNVEADSNICISDERVVDANELSMLR